MSAVATCIHAQICYFYDGICSDEAVPSSEVTMNEIEFREVLHSVGNLRRHRDHCECGDLSAAGRCYDRDNCRTSLQELVEITVGQVLHHDEGWVVVAHPKKLQHVGVLELGHEQGLSVKCLLFALKSRWVWFQLFHRHGDRYASVTVGLIQSY